MNSKVWLVIFGIFALVLIGAAGFFCFGASQKYNEALEDWNNTRDAISGLERKVPYPNKENQDALENVVKEYKDSVTQLFDSLNKFQKPLNTALPNTEFVQLVKTRVEEFRALAASGGMSMDTEEGDASTFQLGFDAYANTIPAPELVPILDYELEAIDHLLRELVAAGAEQLVSFERDPIPGEAGGPEAQESGVVHKYPIRLRFRSTHNSFQKIHQQDCE